jgi:probable phosphoglycerate mutase
MTNTSLKSCSASSTVTPDLEEWNYGEYEGMKSKDIREQRRKQGLDTDEHSWDIWTDGCPGGESPAEVEERCDRLIKEIREKWHAPVFEGKEGKGDVLLVAHGHLLRAFAMRWVGKKLAEKLTMLLEAGGVGTLSYEHHSLEEPALLLGGAFVVEAVQKAEEEQRRRAMERYRAEVPVS